MLLTNI